jgi:predicted permease
MLRALNDLFFRLRALVRRDSLDRELGEELDFHLRMDTDALRAGGLSTQEAEREARRHFGALTRQAEHAREGWGVSLGYEFAADVRHALRQMRRRPAFSFIVTLTLGLGIGATVALFSVVNDLLLRPLPYKDEARLSVFWMDYSWRGEEYDYIRQSPGVFESLAAFSNDGATYRANASDAGNAQLLTYVVATATLFDVLGTRPLLGHAFTAADDRPGADPVIVISYGMWKQDLGGDPKVIGHRIMLNGAPVRVVGVMPKGFYFPTPQMRAWRPLQLDPSTPAYRDNGWLVLVGRTKAGIDPQLVQQDVRRIAKSLKPRFTYPDAWDKTKNPAATPVRTYLVGSMRDPLLLLFGAVGLLLIIACANAAALILARTSDRMGEMAVRNALGAGRGRIARQIVAESLVLAFVAAVLGAVVAAAGFQVLVRQLHLQDGFGETVAPGWPTFGAAFAIALIIAGSVSIAPVRDLLRGRLGGLVSRERGESGLRGGTRRMHTAIIGGQVCLAVVLVFGATLLIRTVDRILSRDSGFDAQGVTTFTILAGAESRESARQALFNQILARVSALPGVTATGMTNRLPVRDWGYQGSVSIVGRPDLDGQKRPNSLYRTASPGFFRAMGMRVAEGRGIDSSDVAGAMPVTVASEEFAKKIWPGESAIGKQINTAYSGTPTTRTIVGVLRETRLITMTGDTPLAMYVPYDQDRAYGADVVLVVKAPGQAAAIVPAVERAIGSLDSRIAIAQVETMEQVVSTAIVTPLRLRFFLGVFAGLALLLGSVGVYGVVSYAVARRRAEFAVRMALGASPRRVLREVLSRGLTPVLVGVALGLIVAGAATRLLGGFLYGIAPTDPTSFITAAGALLFAGGLAALVPGLRAGSTSPTMALRED